MSRTLSERLQALGIRLPDPPRAVAAYVPAKVSDSYCWTSGQLPFNQGQLSETGLVGERVDPQKAKQAARQAALNAVAVAASALGDVDRLIEVIKVVGYVQSAPGFHGQPEVVNGASELFVELFGDSGQHVRSAVGVTSLPLDAPVEIEVVFGIRK